MQKRGHVNTLGYYVIGRQYEHILVAERALGRPLPKGAQVHHWNENKADNRPANLVICPNRAYHILLHYRTRAFDACGNANFVKCSICKKYDDPVNLTRREGRGINYRHKACHAADMRKRNERRRDSNMSLF